MTSSTHISNPCIGQYFGLSSIKHFFRPPPTTAFDSGQNINYFGKQRNGDLIVNYKVVNMKVFKVVKRTRRRQYRRTRHCGDGVVYIRRCGGHTGKYEEDEDEDEDEEEEVVEEHEYECGYVEADGSIKLYPDQQKGVMETSYCSGFKNSEKQGRSEDQIVSEAKVTFHGKSTSVPSPLFSSVLEEQRRKTEHQTMEFIMKNRKIVESGVE